MSKVFVGKGLSANGRYYAQNRSLKNFKKRIKLSLLRIQFSKPLVRKVRRVVALDDGFSSVKQAAFTG